MREHEIGVIIKQPVVEDDLNHRIKKLRKLLKTIEKEFKTVSDEQRRETMRDDLLVAHFVLKNNLNQTTDDHSKSE